MATNLILTLRVVEKSIAFPIPPVGGLFNSLNSNISTRSEAMGMNVIVADASLFNIFAHCTLKGKYRAVGTNRATPLMI